MNNDKLRLIYRGTGIPVVLGATLTDKDGAIYTLATWERDGVYVVRRGGRHSVKLSASTFGLRIITCDDLAYLTRP